MSASASQNACYAAIYNKHSPHVLSTRRSVDYYVLVIHDGIKTYELLNGTSGNTVMYPAGSLIYCKVRGAYKFVGVAVDGISNTFDAISIQVTGIASVFGDIRSAKTPNCVGTSLNSTQVGFCVGKDTADGKLGSVESAEWTNVSLTRA
jgi:hypothetical protein